MRFFSPISPEKAAELLLSAKPEEEKVTLIVLSGEPQRIVATGEYVRLKGQDTAEVAFLVDDAYQGKGLGTLLLERLALIAAKRGVRRFQAFTLAENRPMLNVFMESGFQVKAHREGGEVEVEFEIVLTEKAAERFEWREKVSTIASLHPFFFPKGVAVVGASRDPESIGYRVVENLIFGRFQGPVFPVNEAIGKEGGTVGPLLAYPSLERVPGPVDLAVIAVPKERVGEALEASGRRGVRGVIVLTTGFTPDEAKALADKARRLSMRLLGPGSLGLTHTASRLAAGLVPLPRGRAIGHLQPVGHPGPSRHRLRRRDGAWGLGLRLPGGQGRHLLQRPPAVLGGGRDHPGDPPLPGELRQPQALLPPGPADRQEEAHPGRPPLPRPPGADPLRPGGGGAGE
jgi:GNAT superfamily N-acetyltransferase/predicted CoA-binding protein